MGGAARILMTPSMQERVPQHLLLHSKEVAIKPQSWAHLLRSQPSEYCLPLSVSASEPKQTAGSLSERNGEDGLQLEVMLMGCIIRCKMAAETT